MIYIDFESLGTDDAAPALLGALVAPCGGEARYTAYLLDPRLRPARVAKAACRAQDLAGALGLVLAAEGPIVSWSGHDRKIVRNAGLPADLVHAFDARWRNALVDVRRWKNSLYPDCKLPVVEGVEGHALKRYTEAIGYDIPAALGPGNAAKWLRHVLERLHANGGRYRGLSDRAKRHWHYLLDYNRHDCAGMQAVYQRACRELALEQAYRATTYRAEVDGALLPIRVGRPHTKLDAKLRAANASKWACITAWNPQSVPRPAEENHASDAALKQTLAGRGLRWYPMEGAGDDGSWPPERGVLVTGISRSLADRSGGSLVRPRWSGARPGAMPNWCGATG